MIRVKLIHKVILIITFVLVTLIVLMALVKVPVHVRMSLQSTQLKFQMVDTLNNFFAIENNCHTNNLQVKNFGKIIAPITIMADSIKNNSNRLNTKEIQKSLVINSKNSASLARFQNACLSTLNLSKDAKVSIKTNLPRSNTAATRQTIHITITNIKSPISLFQKNIQNSINLKEVEGIFNTQKLEPTEYQFLDEGVLQIYPNNGEIAFVIRPDKDVKLNESDAFKISDLSVLSSQNGILRSGVQSGLIITLFNNTEVRLNKNSVIKFSPDDEYKITTLQIDNKGISVSLVGVANSLLLSEFKYSLVPNLLLYLSKNNMFLLLINSFFAISAFFIAILKETIHEGDNS